MAAGSVTDTLSLLADGNMERGTYRVETDNSLLSAGQKNGLTIAAGAYGSDG